MTESEKIKQRFYEAFNYLSKVKIIRFKADFLKRYGIRGDRFYYCEANLNSGQFDIEWIAYLCKDYGVRLNWVMYGEGEMFNKKTDDKVLNILIRQRQRY